MAAAAEQREKVVESELADRGELQVEERGLAGVGVHCVDRAGAGQGIVEDVAAGARDDQHRVVRTEAEGLAIHCRVLPAGVVDQRSRVDRVENLLVEPVGERRFVFQFEPFAALEDVRPSC